MKKIFSCLGALVLAVLALPRIAQAGGKFTDWSTPTNLGPAVNSSFGEAGAAISKNGLSLYLNSNRPGGLGETDIYVSQRSSVEEPWGPPVNVLVLNSAGVEQAPALSRDSHYLFFSTDRPGGMGGLDIWVSRREDIHDDFDWETPVPITEINSSVNDAGPAYFENEEGRPQLYFQSQRAGGAGLADIYRTELQEDGTWSAPQRVAELSTPFQEQRPSIRFDGLEIVFQSKRLECAAGREGDELEVAVAIGLFQKVERRLILMQTDMYQADGDRRNVRMSRMFLQLRENRARLLLRTGQRIRPCETRLKSEILWRKLNRLFELSDAIGDLTRFGECPSQLEMSTRQRRIHLHGRAHFGDRLWIVAGRTIAGCRSDEALSPLGNIRIDLVPSLYFRVCLRRPMHDA